MPAGDVLYAINRGDKDLIWRYNSQRYILKMGETAIVPWEAMCLYMGNPDAIDIDERRRNRFDEWQRLKMKYGSYDSLEMWEANKPKVEVMTLTEDKIITVVDDPEGDALTPDTTTRMQNALLQQRMAQLEAELRSIKRMSNIQDPDTVVRVTEDVNPDLEESEQIIGDNQTVPTVSTAPKLEFPRAVTEDTPLRIPGPVGDDE